MFDTIVKRSGRFSIQDNALYGPREYMQARGNDLIDKILLYQDVIFIASIPLNCNEATADLDILLLERMQSDYLAWLST